MTHTETSHFSARRRGATREARSEANPQASLKDLMLKSQDVRLRAERERIIAKWGEAVLADEDMNRIAVLSYGDTIYNRLLAADFPLNGNGSASTSGTKETRAEEKQKRVDEIKENIVKAAKAQVQIMLLDLELPNGKALRDCTGSECRKLSRRMSPWLKKVADAVRPRQKVGDALDEAAVRKLYGR